MEKTYKIVIEKDENGVYIGEVLGLPACYTQAMTIPELLTRLMEVSEGSINLLNDTNNNKININHLNLSLHVDYVKN